jgi:MFS family permease
MSFIQATLINGFAFFLPSIVYQLGFSTNVTRLLSAGPFAVACLGENSSKRDMSPGLFTAYSSTGPPVTLITAFLSDHYELRGITAAIVSMLSVAGFALFLGNVLCLNEDFFSGGHMLIRRRRK